MQDRGHAPRTDASCARELENLTTLPAPQVKSKQELIGKDDRQLGPESEATVPDNPNGDESSNPAGPHTDGSQVPHQERPQTTHSQAPHVSIAPTGFSCGDLDPAASNRPTSPAVNVAVGEDSKEKTISKC
jgi:hypothetical protein